MAGCATFGCGFASTFAGIVNVEIHLAFRLKDQPCEALIERYRKRISPHRRLQIMTDSHTAKLKADRVWRVLCASDGDALSTEAMSDRWRQKESEGTQTAQFLIGGPDGWPGQAKPDLKWAFGAITLPHQLAAAVLAEQIYRIMTILLGHPYHQGHL